MKLPIIISSISYACLIQGLPLEIKRQQDGPLVNLGYATYEGTALEAGVNQFLGIRFAAPPVGNNRFKAPQDPLHEQQVQEAKEFGAVCIGTAQQISDTVDEDCLFLDVFAPSNANENSKLPVWFFIQGGGYAQNSDQNFNATEVVVQSNHSMIFVQINYRVGAFGFLASEDIRKNGDLNPGLLDQRKALSWVQSYIHLFGGDPNHVVIHGDSAGGGSVSHHLTAYGGERETNWFAGAVAESPFLPVQRTVAESESQYTLFVKNANCGGQTDALACLRSQDSATLQAADVISRFPGTPEDPIWYFLPVIDGTLVPDELYTLFENGRFNKVPSIVGDDNDEGTSFVPEANNTADFLDFMKANYPKLTASQLQKINEAYPPSALYPKHTIYFAATAQAYGEATFTCPGIEITKSIAKYFSSDQVWNYRYNVWDADNELAGLGVPHVSEKAAIWGPGNTGPCNNCSYVTYNAPMVPILMNYWISFILALNPNTHRFPSAPEWEPWSSDNGQRIRFQLNATGMETVPQSQADRCGLWKGLASTMQQ